MSNEAQDSGRPSYAAPALTKGLEVLELLATAQAPMTMTMIGEGLGRSKNEIFRMIFALQERGYIERNPETDAFSLTDRLFRLGLRTPRAQDLMTAAMPEMAAIAETVGQSPHLVVVSRGETVVTAAVPGGSDMAFTLRLGYGRLAADATSGQVILAFQDPAVAARIIDDCAAKAPVDRKALADQLAAIRARGHELHASRDFVGITDICCPILGADGHAVAAIIIAFVNRHNRDNRHDEALEALKASCARIAAKLSQQLHFLP
ncbi:MAG: IclR family transcriptional regulator [Amaricoccus sp.]|uniref:IclR family transcriptional regulator n=1 Tax=Amaricoccus sp. TaxID=1872485 RepID=UPI0039E41BB9